MLGVPSDHGVSDDVTLNMLFFFLLNDHFMNQLFYNIDTLTNNPPFYSHKDRTHEYSDCNLYF